MKLALAFTKAVALILAVAGVLALIAGVFKLLGVAGYFGLVGIALLAFLTWAFYPHDEPSGFDGMA